MFWFLNICTFSIFNVNGFVVPDTFNVLMKDDANYKVDLIITDDDYEMIDKEELEKFKIENETEIFKNLNDMARMENYRQSTLITKFVKQPYEEVLPIIVVNSQSSTVKTTYIETILGTPRSTSITANNKITIKIENETDYDYDSLVNEYHDEANNESLSNNAYHIRKSVIDIEDYGAITSLKKIFTLPSGIDNCSEVNGIGLLAVKCLLNDYISQRQPMRDISARLWRIFQIWFLVYFAVAIPLWCTRGWCCCCLCCKFFKPRQTIVEAKKYVIAYPPGDFKNKNGEIRYEPSLREKQCYEEFEHYIKTL